MDMHLVGGGLASGTGVGAWLAAGAVFLLAGGIKGLVGLGLPTVAMALLALWMAPAQAAALLVVPSLVTNAWQLRPLATLWPLARRLAGMQAGTVAGTLLGALAFGAPAGAASGVLLGVALVVYAAWGLAGRPWQVPPAQERWLGPAVGMATGLVTALTGVFILPAVPYLQALGLQRDALVQAMGIAFTTSTMALAAGLLLAPAAAGTPHTLPAAASLVLLLPALAGMALGQRLRQRLPVAVFRRCLFASLAALGTYMVVRVALA
ncbi:sulfite exporter TauE/SafE family protein [Xylophilus sp. Leaf220]|uniref:sulfite exporter TauE/SafE family protein n=1 Tax=Xylophilus sp. Leaf220 TaxID=1735686 RepID=UPI000B182898|nr:sulfite exporter TauE/SafE family protein [Xylophilus sp. Leaf220]